MSEQDDFLIGNNRLDESLLMDMSDMPAEQSAVKPASRKTVRRRSSRVENRLPGTMLVRRTGETVDRRNGMTPYRPIVKTSPPQRRLYVSTVNRWSRSM